MWPPSYQWDVLEKEMWLCWNGCSGKLDTPLCQNSYLVQQVVGVRGAQDQVLVFRGICQSKQEQNGRHKMTIAQWYSCNYSKVAHLTIYEYFSIVTHNCSCVAHTEYVLCTTITYMYILNQVVLRVKNTLASTVPLKNSWNVFKRTALYDWMHVLECSFSLCGYSTTLFLSLESDTSLTCWLELLGTE